MKKLLKNGIVVNVFTGELEKANVLIQNDRIIGVGAYTEAEADETEDVSNKYICPGFIDGHIHIESTMLLPPAFAAAVLPHGTTSVIADPHEIANVCGVSGIEFMLKISEGLPVTVYMMLPSCVPSTNFDESGASLSASDIEGLYEHPRVLGLGEVMDFNGVVTRNKVLMKKIADARMRGLPVNGHAPLLTGKELDAYISAGIYDDHECSTPDEAMERIRRGQYVMIRQGTAAKNLNALLPLFEKPWSERCLLAADDKHIADVLDSGHIDGMIRQAAQAGKDPVAGIRMATIQTATRFQLSEIGAIAPGYKADILVLNDLRTVTVSDVYKSGKKCVQDGKLLTTETVSIPEELKNTVFQSIHIKELNERNFMIRADGIQHCRVIGVIPGELITDERITDIDFSADNGIDTKRDILKIAVIERHHNTGHIGIGFISGMGLKEGAIASSVAHDSHNIVVIGTNEADMAFAVNQIRDSGGGIVVVKNKTVDFILPLPYAGLMSEETAETVALKEQQVRTAAHKLGAFKELEPFMTMAFVSLPVIPHIKLTSKGLVDVKHQKIVPLIIDGGDK